MIIHIILSIIFYLIILYLSVNLLGYFVRGLFVNPELERLKKESHEFVKNEIQKSERAGHLITIIAFVVLLVYLYLLTHFWNIGIAFVAVIIMVGRLPDLIWEIKNGRKIDSRLLKKNFVYYFSALSPIFGYPLLFYFLYYFK